MEQLVARLLASDATPAMWGAAQKAARGRRVRLVDSTSVAKASVKLRQACGLWRIHAVFDLPAERFSFFELTDEKGAESLSRMAIAPGDILIADRGYCRPTLLQA